MSNNFHLLKIHELETFDTRERILRKTIRDVAVLIC